jgi:uncharacterized repeat protein (TIGR01451 family)
MKQISFDPNDKSVEEGIQEARYRKIDLDLTYTIRFQNTGTDTAFFVKVIDTLDVNFDVTTFELLAASHEVNYSLNDRILSFKFHDILLPDSIKDEPGSHGFIKYRIRNKAGISSNTIVRNSAAIYFDYNLPIFTNEVSNVYVENLPQIITDYDKGRNKILVDVYPNPAEKYIMVKAESEYSRAELLNSLGVRIKDFIISNGESISLEGLHTGTYFIVFSNGSSKSVRKIVVR